MELTVNKLDESPNIYGDLDQLQEALLNILLNACEAMEYSGSLTVTESIDVVDNEQFFVISIKDSGPGIANNDLEVLFVPFFSTKEQGTGLGLPIAKGIIEEHGGELAVASSSHEGTEFIVAIPVETK